MTDHPITPPPELVKQWRSEPEYATPGRATLLTISEQRLLQLLARSAEWSANEELEACIDLVRRGPWCSEKLRAARRPKPPSLKERALDDLKTMTTVPPGMSPLAPETVERIERIRCALEALPDD